MENIKKLIKQNVPPFIMVPIIRAILALPASISAYVVADFTAPTKSQWSWIRMIEKEDWKGAWIGPGISECKEEAQLLKRIREADMIIYKVHGGGFRIGNCIMYMDVFTTWIELLKARHGIKALILSVDYSLAPKHMYPIPVLECVAAYQYLTSTLKVPGSKIVLSGDSAGGALCLETLIRMYAPNICNDLNAPRTNHNIEIPAGLFLVSPLVSGNTSKWLWQYSEDLLTPLLIKQVFKEYLGFPNANTDDLHLLKLALITSGFDRFLPQNLLVYVGEREVMREDILTLANMVKQFPTFNVEIRKENYEHDWYFIREVVKLDERHLLVESDEQFAAFAAKALREANEAAPSATEKLAVSTDNTEFTHINHHPHSDRLIPDIENTELESEAVIVSAIRA